MRLPSGLQARLALGLGLALSLLWLGAAAFTALSLRHEMQEVFDSVLQETAQRLLPLAVLEITNREEGATAQRLAPIREHPEFFTYLVRDADGAVLMRSHAADPTLFPDWDGPGFRQTDTHRFYAESALQGSIRLIVAEPLAHRQGILAEILMRQILPLVLVIPLTLGVVGIAVRLGLGGLRRFRLSLAARGARDLSPLPTGHLPAELRPVAETLNSLLARLSAAFEAERSFAANAAHELRTPLAGAIAQVQRLRQEAVDPATIERAASIEETLKRLTRLAERLLQLARAEGGRLRGDTPADLRPVARMVIDDLARRLPPDRLRLTLPAAPVLSDLDPDALGIVLRNLVENGLRHGAAGGPVSVVLAADGLLVVENDGPPVAPAALDRLTDRFARASGGDGSGLGLAIVAAVADRIGAPLVLQSPRAGRDTGFSAALRLPVVPGA